MSHEHIVGSYALTCTLAVLFLSIAQDLNAQDQDSTAVHPYMHSLDFCPMSPLIRIWAVHYCYRITPHSEIIVGPYYANIKYEDIGNTCAPGFIIGYRQYVWKKLHIDYQLMPQWDHFYEKNEDRQYPLGFDLWNEFRVGYSLDFKLWSVPVFANVQWPFGFA